ncbi:hypothetical protein M0R45_004309 [Rubus argutus]|uniref:Uncharacterized protein n=1 Tax=Rubus argutus TaxID=59490 RepID=A0AAW1YJE1_RUBAR
MGTGKSIKVQSALFCIVFIAILALTECSESSIGEKENNNITSATSSNSSKIVVDNLRVRGDYDHVKDFRPREDIQFCSKECNPTKPCWCCDRRGRESQCFSKNNDCLLYCA